MPGTGPDSGFKSTSGEAGSGDATSSLSGDTGAGQNDDGGLIVAFDGASDGSPVAPCADGGLQCYVPTCPGGATTSLSGTVYDPAGRNPLYNAIVFVPDDPTGKLPVLKPGTNTCDTCYASLGGHVAVTATDPKGHFKIDGVPVAAHLPFVVQIGKWRRETFLDNVTPCQDNQVPAALSRLPRNRMEGDMPQMLMLTGGCDDLGCFLRNIGVDASEFTAPHGGGRVDVYQGKSTLGNGAGLSNGTAGTWGTPVFTKASYEYYDIALFSCECSEHQESAAGRAALHDWVGEGGRVLAIHYQYTWFSAGPTDFQGVANWNGPTSANNMGNFMIDTSFAMGSVLQSWLNNVSAANGNAIALSNVASSVSTVNPPTLRWIYDPNSSIVVDGALSTGSVKFLSFPTPIGGIPGSDAGAGLGRQYCGKASFTDIHPSTGLLASAASIPGDCSVASSLTPQQAALEFLLFDLSACIAPTPDPGKALPPRP